MLAIHYLKSECGKKSTMKKLLRYNATAALVRPSRVEYFRFGEFATSEEIAIILEITRFCQNVRV